MNDSFYNPSAGNNENRTYIPGMKRKQPAAGEDSSATSQDTQSVRIELQSRPVAGILFSISKDNCGEIFPVYVGRNTVGNNPESDVYLSEETVDKDHALILIRKVTLGDGTKKTTMTISDSGSEFGTCVNDIPLDDDIIPIKPNDRIQLGNAYVFQFIPLDAESAGLATSANFKATKRVENRPIVSNDYMNYIGKVVDDKIYPTSVGEEDEQTFYGRSTKQKEDHSSKKTL